MGASQSTDTVSEMVPETATVQETSEPVPETTYEHQDAQMDWFWPVM